MGHTKAKSLGIVSLKTNQSNPFGTKSQDGKLIKRTLITMEYQGKKLRLAIWKLIYPRETQPNQLRGKTQGSNQYP